MMEIYDLSYQDAELSVQIGLLKEKIRSIKENYSLLEAQGRRLLDEMLGTVGEDNNAKINLIKGEPDIYAIKIFMFYYSYCTRLYEKKTEMLTFSSTLHILLKFTCNLIITCSICWSSYAEFVRRTITPTFISIRFFNLEFIIKVTCKVAYNLKTKCYLQL
jgi:hypothetical protein